MYVAIAEEKVKRCIKCGSIKVITKFCKKASCKEGYANECKECHNLRNKLRYNSFKTSGVCAACGVNNPVEGKNFCLECLDNYNTKNRKISKRKKSLNECTRCKNPALPGHTMCQTCSGKIRPKLREKHRLFSIKIGQYFDDTCAVCGRKSDYFESYDVHHLNPLEKEFGIATMRNKAWEIVILELSKCVYVCAGCHRSLHFGRFDNLINSGKLILIPGEVKEKKVA